MPNFRHRIFRQPWRTESYGSITVREHNSTYAQRGGGGGGHVKGYQASPKIHVIRVVFQDQALYARTSFRGAKMCKSGKKGVFFWSYRQVLERT